MVKAPGNQIRMNLFEQSNSISKLMMNSIKPYFQLLVYLLPKFFIYIFAALPFIYLGSKYKMSSFGYFKKLNFGFFIFTTFLLFLLFYVSLLPGIYATSVLTPLRALNHLTVFSILFFSFWGFVLGRKTAENNYDKLIYVTIITLFLYVIFSFYIDIPRMREYKNEIDNRIYNLNLLNSKFIEHTDSVVLVQKLEICKYKDFSSHTYYFFDRMNNIESKNKFEYFPVLTDEITADPGDFRNVALRNRLKLKFNVKIGDN
jgi:hypothetical protein